MRVLLALSSLTLALSACPRSEPYTVPPDEPGPEAVVGDPGDDTKQVAKPDPAIEPPPNEPIDPAKLEIQASGETIYMWGGIHMDEQLEAPLPLTKGVLRPGDPLELVSIFCLVKGDQARASVKCSATGRREAPYQAQQARLRLNACSALDEQSPSRADIKAVEKSWKTLVRSDLFKARGLSWNAARWEPPKLGSGARVYEIVVRHEWQGEETKTGGCENPPPDVGCDPYVIKTGRMTTLKQETVSYAYADAPGIALGQFFGGRAPPLHRMRIGERNERGYVQDHPNFKVAGAKDGIENYRRRQLAAYDAFDAAARHSPNVRAALRINRAVTALHLKDLDLLRKQVAALRMLDKREKLDRAALQLDVNLAVFDRVLAGEWLLEDPCAPQP